MCCKFLSRKLLPFCLGICIGIVAVERSVQIPAPLRVPGQINQGSGASGPGDVGIDDLDAVLRSRPPISIPPNKVAIRTEPIKIFSKPRPDYTEEVRENNTQGVVRLRITFLAHGEVGSISPVLELPDNLTEQAVLAARKIKFWPQKVNSVPVSVTRLIEYTFTIY
jgi:TonB family protein